MEVEVTVKQGLEQKTQHLKRLKRQVSIQDDVFVNRVEDEDDVVFLNEKLNEKFNEKFKPHNKTTPRRPFNHHSLKKARSLNQTIFASHQPTAYDSTRKQFNFYLEGDYGWFIVLFAFVLRLIITGPVSNFNLLYFHLKTNVFPNHQYTEILGCLNKISGHLVSPLLTILVFKYKVLRLFAVLGCMLCALTLLFSAFSFKFHQFVLSFCLLNGIFSELVQVCSTAIIIQYFKKKLWLVEMIVSLSDAFSYSLFSVLLHFLFSAYSWRKSLQLLSILTSSSLILALFFRPASIYHPQRRAILHLKYLKQERQKFKRLPLSAATKTNNGGLNKATTYKLSDHFRQQSLEIAKDDRHHHVKTARTNGSVSSNGLNNSNSTAITTNQNHSNSLTSSRSASSRMNTTTSTNSSTIAQSTANSNNKCSNDAHCNEEDSSKFKTNKQDEDEEPRKFSFSFLFQRQSTRQSRIKFNSTSSMHSCLNGLSKLIQSTGLLKYLDLLRSRDLKFIILFCFLTSFSQVYFAIQYTDQCQASNVTAENFRFSTSQQQQPHQRSASSQKVSTSHQKDHHRQTSSSEQTAARNLKLINPMMNFVNLLRANVESSNGGSTLHLTYLNVCYSVGYCVSLLFTSVLVSRLCLTSASSCKLAILGSCLNVIMIATLNVCLFNGTLLDSLLVDQASTNQSLSIANSNATATEAQTTNLPISLLIRLAVIRVLNFLERHVYTVQITFYILYACFQAQLNYSIKLLLLERFSNKKLCKVISLQRFIIGLGQLFLLLIRLTVNHFNLNQLIIATSGSSPLVGTSIFGRSNDDYTIFISNFVIFLSALVAIISLHFISNRSINRFKGHHQKNKVVKNSKSFSRLFLVFDKFKVLKGLFSRVLDLFRQHATSEQSRVAERECTAVSVADCQRNRFNYRKQLSESNLKELSKLNSPTTLHSRYNSDLMRLKSLEETVLDFKDFIDLTSSYMIDCVLCKKSYIVHLDFDRVQLIELCSLDELGIDKVASDKSEKEEKLEKVDKLDKCEKVTRREKVKNECDKINQNIANVKIDESAKTHSTGEARKKDEKFSLRTCKK